MQISLWLHHFSGVQSVEDPLLMTNYELIYSHPELMIDWLPILGNHEYRGNTQAIIDYSNISRRWNMPGRYCTKVYEEDTETMFTNPSDERTNAYLTDKTSKIPSCLFLI